MMEVRAPRIVTLPGFQQLAGGWLPSELSTGYLRVDNRSGGSMEPVDNRSGGSMEALHNSKFCYGSLPLGYLRLPPRPRH
jgi:hypothetical protein